MSVMLQASPQELRQQFLRLCSPQDVAQVLDIDYGVLVYHLFKVPDDEKYTIFSIPKRSGGSRTIAAPATALKLIQQKLNQVLQATYQPKPSVHGFVQGRSIVTNASRHLKRRYLFNVDLKDFFPSINFGRVRGMFMAAPYKLDPPVATVLAQICCFQNTLPQGAPTSPIVSNMICPKMDSQLQRLAKGHRCHYTRYADDITFSTTVRDFPSALARSGSAGQLEVGPELRQVIEENGFKINPEKVRLRTWSRRQEVTGLTSNEKPNVRRKYVRQIRAMLHAWRKFGLDAAQEEFISRWDSKPRSPDKEPTSFGLVVKGKIEFLGMVRGRDDVIYLRFLRQLGALAPELVPDWVLALPDTAEQAKAMGQSARVFVSSTWDDLQPERKAVEAALDRMRDTDFAGMEHFGSRPETPKEVSLAEVDASDVYIGIFAHRYGSGITEAEYRRAREQRQRISCLVYFKDDSVPVLLGHVERDPDATAKLEALKTELKKQHTVSFFETSDQLATKIVTDLHNLLITLLSTRGD